MSGGLGQGHKAGEAWGLGIVDLTTLGYPLCLRWSWLALTELNHPWAALPNPAEKAVQVMFQASIMVSGGGCDEFEVWRTI
jgi:hypothetical protein